MLLKRNLSKRGRRDGTAMNQNGHLVAAKKKIEPCIASGGPGEHGNSIHQCVSCPATAAAEDISFRLLCHYSPPPTVTIRGQRGLSLCVC